ncbi:hypothetical protein NCCP2331_34760 [Sporosarcina sp. NCCP-2331]|nr:hypothetical protein NCCP2331_34760 [Sporosarcina sp. NCCP-2331]GLB57679.1 hypothetical protein NCCP2378_34690 [Sporosarcina sp. NCCP-2378]
MLLLGRLGPADSENSAVLETQENRETTESLAGRGNLEFFASKEEITELGKVNSSLEN